MLSKAKVKLIKSLKLHKYRQQQGLFVAEGTTNVLDFLNSDLTCADLFATPHWIATHKDNLSLKTITEVNEKEIRSVSFLKNPSEVVAVFSLPHHEPINSRNIAGLVLMLDDIRDPGNLGTIIRTADWFGIRDIICSDESVDAFNPKVVQASMGSLARVRVYTADLVEIVKNRPDYLNTFGAVLDGSPLNEVAKPKTGIIIIGNEAHGISRALLPMIDFKITIPGFPGHRGSSAESLNASIATAIICYEFRK